MANKWTGIEQTKYDQTASWYVDAYYGSDTDVDSVGSYNASTNPTGWGGPTRPFKSIQHILDNKASFGISDTFVVGSGYYAVTSNTFNTTWRIIGDGLVTIDRQNVLASGFGMFYNITLINFKHTGGVKTMQLFDCRCFYCSILTTSGNWQNTIFVESTVGRIPATGDITQNCIFYRCTAQQLTAQTFINNILLECQTVNFNFNTPRPIGVIVDYCILIGKFGTRSSINGKLSEITLEDFKADGNYFTNSYSEVDLFGTESGSGATLTQIQTIFNNFVPQIYIDNYHTVDFSLKPTVSDIVRYGGLNGTFIGVQPVAYSFSAQTLFDNRNVTNTTGIVFDSLEQALAIDTGLNEATYESNELEFANAIDIDVPLFIANFVYNSDGTLNQGVANQRIDTTPDLVPNNTVAQKTVYDFQLAYAPNSTDALSAFKNFELNRTPYVDDDGDSDLDNNYDPLEATRITVKRLKIRCVLRRVVIA